MIPSDGTFPAQSSARGFPACLPFSVRGSDRLRGTPARPKACKCHHCRDLTMPADAAPPAERVGSGEGGCLGCICHGAVLSSPTDLASPFAAAFAIWLHDVDTIIVSVEKLTKDAGRGPPLGGPPVGRATKLAQHCLQI